MCTYNGEPFLREQLDSIAGQTKLPAELIICDDGSVDSTLEIARDFARVCPFDVKVHRNPKNLRVTRNFEQAIGCCSGDFIPLCDQDDVWYPPKLATLSAILSADPSAGGVFSNADLIDESSRSLGRELWSAFGFTPKFRRRFMHGEPVSVVAETQCCNWGDFHDRASLRSELCRYQHRGSTTTGSRGSSF